MQRLQPRKPSLAKEEIVDRHLFAKEVVSDHWTSAAATHSDLLHRTFPFDSLEILGSVFGRTDFSRIFVFGPPDFFADFVAGFFLLIFVGKSAQKNPPGKSPAKSSKIYTTKIPDTFLQRGRAKNHLGQLFAPPVCVFRSTLSHA